MTNQDLGNQFELAKQMAQQSGIKGTVYIDFNPEAGFLRLKLKVTPPQQQSVLTSSFAQVVAQASQMFGIQVKVHQSSGGDGDDRK
jgi:hypothetical protein